MTDTIRAILNDDIKAKYPCCPECNAILETNSTSGELECPNACELLNYLD